MKNRLLLIDDRLNFCQSLSQNFSRVGYTCDYATNGMDALAKLAKAHYAVVLLDVSLGDEDGLELLDRIKGLKPQVPVVMITGYGTIDLAVRSMKQGAFDFCQKPLNFNRLQTTIEHAVKFTSLTEANEELRSRIQQLSPKLVSTNREMISVCERAEKLAATQLPVLIFGESGTGKEILAEMIHNCSDRNAKELVKINCAAFPENLLDNELFGHEKGAYTGADARFAGVFEKADRSSLLLDELGDMSLPTQAKILRAIQNQEIRRIGGSKNITIDVRFIASTNKDLHHLMVQKEFREDLYYRLNAALLVVPPLRERKEDIPLLVEQFLKESGRENGRTVPGISSAVMNRLMSYEWPGNVRELKNAINYAAAMTVSSEIQLSDLPPLFGGHNGSGNGRKLLDENEKQLIVAMLEQHDYNKIRTAEALSISRKTLYNKLRRHGIPVRQF